MTTRINSTVPCYRGAQCNWPACKSDCDGRPGLAREWPQKAIDQIMIDPAEDPLKEDVE